ncbi:MAG: prepilin-type N-terminal cleavage/methylation domain-containing protein [bacterium]
MWSNYRPKVASPSLARTLDPGLREQHRDACGLTLIEVLVAMAILSIAAAAIIGLYSTGFLAGAMARRMSGAVALAQQRLEASRSPCVLGDEGPESTDPAFPGYRWQTKTSEVRPGLREVTATVTWQERGQDRSLSLTTLVRDPRR